MKRRYLIIALLAVFFVGCNNHQVPDPEINNFSADPTTLPKRDTVTFQIDAVGDFITFYDGKLTIDLSETEMPYEHVVSKIRFNVSPPADTIYAKIAVTNVYDTDNIKTVIDSIEIILLD